jgi:hypothetical protein
MSENEATTLSIISEKPASSSGEAWARGRSFGEGALQAAKNAAATKNTERRYLIRFVFTSLAIIWVFCKNEKQLRF